MTRWLPLLPLLLVPAWLLAREEKYPSPREAAARMTVPEGFRVRLVAGEPTFKKPIAAATDERGRLWVVESDSYPHWIKDGRAGKDRILIFEPQADGSWSSKVFLDNGTNLSGIALGFGGVWLASVPNFLFLPVRDDRPAGPAVTLLDGFNLHDSKHNVFNSLCWGPDGWLYGLNGIQSRSKLGAPGSPDSKRVKMDCGVWRYHPQRKVVEAVAHGTTNPWGLDWDDFGEMFITNCVIKHAFHVVPGAHFVRMYGQDVNPHTYRLIESCADHIHWGGGEWTSSRGGQGEHSVAGGGHAHAGALIYLGDNWPAEYRNRLFMGNIHGSRLNQDALVRSRSGYVIQHKNDFLLAHDPWFRPLWLHAAHDGGVYVGDWHDTGECHNFDKTHPSGRVYHVTFGLPRRPARDLGQLDDVALARLQAHRDEWHVRQARRLLTERAVRGNLSKEAIELLWQQVTTGSVPTSLRAIWALYCTGSLPEARLLQLLESAEPELRLWAVRLLVDPGNASEAVVQRLTKLARDEKAEPVLLSLASALQRIPLDRRWSLAEALLTRSEVVTDPYLPLMLWYGVEPLPAADPQRGAELLSRCAVPVVRRFLARRLTALENKSALGHLVSQLLKDEAGPAVRRDLLDGMSEALAGRRSVAAPPRWSEVYRKLGQTGDAEVRARVNRLSVLFGDAQALATLTRLVGDTKADPTERTLALEVLLDRRGNNLPALLRELLDDAALRSAALRGLAAFDDPQTPKLILARYAKLSESEKADALSTLASRVSYARELLAAMERKEIAPRDVSPFLARQIASLGDREVRKRLVAIWGEVRSSAKNKEQDLARYRQLATPEQRQRADLSAGRLVWQKTCASCHRLFGEGGQLGPDLTGSQRRNADYILTKVLDPGAAVPKEYQLTRIVTTTGRVLTGYVKQDGEQVLLLQTPTEEVRILKSDIEQRDQQSGSLMPDDQLKTLKEPEIRDLLAYLASEKQVDLPADVKGK